MSKRQRQRLPAAVLLEPFFFLCSTHFSFLTHSPDSSDITMSHHTPDVVEKFWRCKNAMRVKFVKKYFCCVLYGNSKVIIMVPRKSATDLK